MQDFLGVVLDISIGYQHYVEFRAFVDSVIHEIFAKNCIQVGLISHKRQNIQKRTVFLQLFLPDLENESLQND